MLRRSLLLAVFLLTGLVTLHAGINDGLVAWYPLDGTAVDASGNGHDGTVHGAAATSDRFGSSSSAMLFNGSSDYIEIPHAEVFMFDSSFSLSAWVRPARIDYSYAGQIVCKAQTGNEWNLFFRDGDIISFFEYGSGTNVELSAVPIGSAVNSWHHVCSVYNAATGLQSLYWDGTRIAEQSAPLPETNYTGAVGIGAEADVPQGFFEGTIDEVRIYDRALTESEIDLLAGLPADTGAGTLWLVGGTLNAVSLSPDTDIVEVSSGATISGNVLLRAFNSFNETVTTPLAYAWSWGNRQSDFTQVSADTAAGATDWDVSINLGAPSTRGLYALLFTFDDTDSTARLFSVDEAGAGPSWNDGNDLLDLGWDQLNFAGEWGFVDAWSRKNSSGAFSTHDLPLAPVFIDVSGATTGSGTIILTGGTLAGQTLSEDNWKIEAEAGETLSGNITFDVENSLSGSSRSPLGYTWSWGDRETDLVEINNNINSGTTSWNVPLNLIAPDRPGNYYLLFGFNGVEFNISQVLSCDNWAAGGELQWNDGNDYVDLDGMRLEYAHRHGYVPDWQYRMDGTNYSDKDIPVMPVLVHVGEGRIFADGFEDSGTRAWTSGEGHNPPELKIDLGGGVTMDLIYIPPGTFMMGSPEDERGRGDDEDLHEVTLTHGYYLGKYEVTQAQWEAVMGSNPAHDYGVGDNYPVYYVSWDDVCGGTTGSDCTADSFIGKLNTSLGTTKFRLPTEAEWEYAARAGTTGPFSFDTSVNPEWDLECGSFPEADPYMWWCGNSSQATHPVGSKQLNGFGLYDIHGNVYEWVADWYGEYPDTAVTDPTGPSTGNTRIMRGGSWYWHAWQCRSAFRTAYYPGPSSQGINIGFRLARTLE